MMSGIQQPFYSFLITLTSHHPYRLPEPHRKLDTGELEGTMLGDYLNSIHYVDEAFGELIEQMKQQGLWDNTILIIYGDHDNSIKDQSAYEQWLGRELSELDMEQMMNQVPLLIRLPDGAHGGTIDPEAAGMMNVAPSILHLLGISSEPYYWIGTSLFDERDRLIPLRSGAFPRRMYIIFHQRAAHSRKEPATAWNRVNQQRSRPAVKDTMRRRRCWRFPTTSFCIICCRNSDLTVSQAIKVMQRNKHKTSKRLFCSLGGFLVHHPAGGLGRRLVHPH